MNFCLPNAHKDILCAILEWFLLRARVSVNDIKMSAQDLSCPAFVFLLLRIVF